MLTHELNIYPNREHGTAQFYAVQGESGARELRMDLYDAQGQPVKVVETKALLYVLKPDRNVAVIQCETVTNGKLNQVSCLLTLQAATCPGICSLLLQVLTDTGELRYDNMQLKVFPSEADAVSSRSDLGPLAQLIQSSGQIETLLKETQDTAKLLESIIRDYTRGITPEITGKLDTGEEAAADFTSTLAVDTNGNLLFVDCRTWGGTMTKYSMDFGRTWEPASLQKPGGDSDFLCRLCIGGEKFLCYGDNEIIWVTVSPAGQLSISPPAANPVPAGARSADRGAYVNGKYWLFPAQSGTGDETTKAYPPFYFTGIGTEHVTVNLPHNQMCARDILYDAETGTYFLCGGYVVTTPKSGYGWVLASTDLIYWDQIGEWNDGGDDIYALTLQNGVLCAYPRYDSGDTLTVHSIQASEYASGNWVVKKTPHTNKFYTEKAASCEVCSAVVSNGERYLAYTKDGKEHTIVNLTWPEEFYGMVEAIAGYGRRLFLCYGPYYAVYRMDLAGESILKDLEDAQSAYESMLAQADKTLQGAKEELAEAAAGVNEAKADIANLVQASPEDLIPGSPLPTGTLYLVYR